MPVSLTELQTHKLRQASTRRGGWRDSYERAVQSGEWLHPDHEKDWIGQPEDVPAGCTHYVMVDGKGSGGACRELRTAFAQNLTADLPSIALGAYDTEWNASFDYLSRKLPVLLLDTRPHPRAL